MNVSCFKIVIFLFTNALRFFFQLSALRLESIGFDAKNSKNGTCSNRPQNNFWNTMHVIKIESKLYCVGIRITEV
jgi:hypothetical protein